ncbi:hypothetical protein [Sulfobacillus harzensis]|uniref:Uncharacterized protein n=1 Tax=Sulfobacillus harzensis TaxID=2729629 RepID=A0A7Y0Q4Q4_9FIRM|nr:hypothetical protein [Sulfobacillus harzensis]NMP23479.1 hypothetical protein [Sulfobacillus harzensis]
MDIVPTPEEALLLDEAWAQLLGAAATLKELAEFVATVAEQMRQHDPGLAHHPPFHEALSQCLQQRQALRMTPQGFSVQGADACFYTGLAQALGVSPEGVMPRSDEGGTAEAAWFQQLRRWVAEGAVWPAVGSALEALDEEGTV